MDWFERLTGFREDSPERVRERLFVDGPWLTSKANERRWRYGAGDPDFRAIADTGAKPP